MQRFLFTILILFINGTAFAQIGGGGFADCPETYVGFMNGFHFYETVDCKNKNIKGFVSTTELHTPPCCDEKDYCTCPVRFAPGDKCPKSQNEAEKLMGTLADDIKGKKYRGRRRKIAIDLLADTATLAESFSNEAAEAFCEKNGRKFKLLSAYQFRVSSAGRFQLLVDEKPQAELARPVSPDKLPGELEKTQTPADTNFWVNKKRADFVQLTRATRQIVKLPEPGNAKKYVHFQLRFVITQNDDVLRIGQQVKPPQAGDKDFEIVENAKFVSVGKYAHVIKWQGTEFVVTSNTSLTK